MDRLARWLREVPAIAREIGAELSRPRPGMNWGSPPAVIDNPWRRYWGCSYGPELKQWLLEPVFEELERQDRIGDLIVDVGRILVDIAADNSRAANGQKIRFDAEKIGEPKALSFRKGWVRVCKFLGLDPDSRANGGGADTIVFSDLLNYVDFEKVLGGFAEYLKPGGRIIVSNLPMRGNEGLFSGKGLKDNRELYRFLEEREFEIEHKSFPCRPDGGTEEAEEMIVLVARKRGGAAAKFQQF